MRVRHPWPSHAVWVMVVVVGASAACSDAAGPRPDVPVLRPNDDIVAAGRDVQITDSVAGDIILAGASLTFEGFAGGSYLGAGGDQSITGDVQGSIRAAGGSVELDATVGRNVTLAAASVTVGPGARIARNAYLAGRSVRFEGTASGDVFAAAEEVVVDGDIGGDVQVEARTITIGPDARIRGELRYRSDDDVQPEVSADANVEGGLVALGSRREAGRGLGAYAFRLLAFVLTASVVVALIPGTVAGTARELKDRPAAALGRGLLWLLAVPLLVVVSAVTVLGIPLALVLAVVYGLSLYLAPIVPALWLGTEIVRGREPTDRKNAVLLTMVGGAVVVFALLLPWIGFVARLAAICAGLGSIALLVERGRSGARAFSAGESASS